MLEITPVKREDITHIYCPDCREKLPRVGLLKGSSVKGLTFRCRKCGKLWKVTSTA